MSIYGIGTDIVEIARIEQALSRHGERFATRLLHPDELPDWQAALAPAAWLAKRFAAKEAFAKALGTSIPCRLASRHSALRASLKVPVATSFLPTLA
ncbi:MAG: holo-ACP synthase, partial [Burkholderiales bacterium]